MRSWALLICCIASVGRLSIAQDWYPYSASTWQGFAQECASGARQSPIDFGSCTQVEERTAIAVTWATQAVALVNNGHTVQITAQGSSKGSITVNGATYTLVQCHFHWDSEHTVDGKMHPFEVHCVHSKDGTSGASQEYGVFGQFYEVMGTTDDSFLQQFDGDLPVFPASQMKRRLSSSDNMSFSLLGDPMHSRRLATPVASSYTGPTNFKLLYGSNGLTHYWSYQGSLTTPPCTQAVDFYILMKPAAIPLAQLQKFKAAIGWTKAGGNWRATQPLGSRVVSGCHTPSSVQHFITQLVNNEVKSAIEGENKDQEDMLITLVVFVVLVFLILVYAIVLLRKRAAYIGVPDASPKSEPVSIGAPVANV